MCSSSPVICGSLLAIAIVTGCSHKSASDSVPEVGKIELQDLWEMYSTHAAKSGRPPAGPDDLKAEQRGSPLGGRALRDPNFVIVYGTPVGGSSVLAYHKDVPAQGGLVLLSDGSIKTLSASEFQAAPKAGK